VGALSFQGDEPDPALCADQVRAGRLATRVDGAGSVGLNPAQLAGNLVFV
jgi:hypothetical protein